MKNIMKNIHSLQINDVKLSVHEAREKSNTEMSMSCHNVKICHALSALKKKKKNKQINRAQLTNATGSCFLYSQ